MYSMISLKSKRDLDEMRAAGRIVAETFERLRELIQPGVTLRELDEAAAAQMRRQGAEPLYKGYRGSKELYPPFPGNICTSVNDEICHGFPDWRWLREGDIVGVDIGLRYGHFCADACMTYAVGTISAEAQRLLAIAQESLRVGIEAAQPNAHLHDIGCAVERYAKSEQVAVVRDLTGHGIGRSLHEIPTVFHVRRPGRGLRLRPGMTFTVEPMINLGTHRHITLPDGWTQVTADGSLSAQFEHTIAITANGPEILTAL